MDEIKKAIVDIIEYLKWEDILESETHIGRAMLNAAIKEGLYLCVVCKEEVDLYKTIDITRTMTPVFSNVDITNRILSGNISAFGYDILIENFDIDKMDVNKIQVKKSYSLPPSIYKIQDDNR